MVFNLFKTITGVGDEEKERKEPPTAADTVNSIASGIYTGLQKVGSGASKAYDALKAYGEQQEKQRQQQLEQERQKQEKIAYNAQQSSGLNAVRPYVTNTLKPYGYEYNESDFTFNPNNNNVTFKGYNLGASDFFDDVGNTNYYDTKRLDDVLKNTIIPGLGLYRSTQDMIGQGQEWTDTMLRNLNDIKTTDKKEIGDMYKQLANYSMTNPMDTDLGKSIMEYFQLKGSDASYAQAASNAADNSGNIDSFAAANAARWQNAFNKSGIEAVMNARSSHINDSRGVFSDWSSYNDGMYNQLMTDINAQNYINQRLVDNEQQQFNNTQAEKMNEYSKAYDASVLTGETAPLISQIMGYEDANKPLYNNVMDNKYLDLENKKLQMAEDDAQRALLAQLLPGLMSNSTYFGQYVNPILKQLGIELPTVGQYNAGYTSQGFP